MHRRPFGPNRSSTSPAATEQDNREGPRGGEAMLAARMHFARRLLDDTDLTVLDIAFAAGFGSLRQFNRTMREVFRASPADLRHRRHRADRLAADGGLTLRLPVVPGYDCRRAWPIRFLTRRG